MHFKHDSCLNKNTVFHFDYYNNLTRNYKITHDQSTLFGILKVKQSVT